MVAALDITGQRYGRLFAIERIGTAKNGTALWRFQCDCGKEIVRKLSKVREGANKSCGCARIEWLYKPYGVSAKNDKLRQMKNGAKKRGYKWELTDDEAIHIMQGVCAYCGTEPMTIQKGRGNNGNFIYNGIDRIDNDLGYILSNVVPCCHMCNAAKSAFTREEFLNWATRLARHILSLEDANAQG